jgi:hypothetical protein
MKSKFNVLPDFVRALGYLLWRSWIILVPESLCFYSGYDCVKWFWTWRRRQQVSSETLVVCYSSAQYCTQKMSLLTLLSVEISNVIWFLRVQWLKLIIFLKHIFESIFWNSLQPLQYLLFRNVAAEFIFSLVVLVSSLDCLPCSFRVASM